MMLKSFVFLLLAADTTHRGVGVSAFLSHDLRSSSSSSVPVPSFISSPPTTTATALSMAAMSYDDMLERIVHFEATIPKPLGVIFGENPDPYFGLVVDDVSEGMNGGIAGLRVGDQLMAINEEVVVGKDFDTVMGMLRDEPGTLNLIVYRGPVSQLFTAISNQLREDESFFDDEEEEEEEEEVIMDESYESPVRIEVEEEKPLTPGDVMKAFGKLGSMFGEAAKETLTAKPEEETASSTSPPPKKKTGFFGIGGESVQLDGNEARGYRMEQIEPDDL